MKIYLTFNEQLRIETDENIIENLKRKGWIEISQPSYNSNVETCIWENGQWVLQPIIPSYYTAEEWLDVEGFQDKRPTVCLYLKLQLDSANKVSPKLIAVQQWMDNIITQGVFNPEEKRNDWQKSPYNFSEAIQEALQILNS